VIKLRIDTREQKPLTFNKSMFDEITVQCNPVADYWCEVNGEEVPIVFERKGLGDLFGTLTSGHDRFKREIGKAAEFGLTIIVLIEGTMREVAAGYEHSSVKGDTILKKLATLHIKYGIEYHFFQDRREMARFIEETFTAVARHWKKEKHGKA